MTTTANAPAPTGTGTPGPKSLRRRMGRLSPRYVLRKLTVSFGTLIFVVLFNFFLFRVLPGDPAKAFAPRGRTTNLQEIRHRMGTDLPMYRQFLKYINDLVHLNLGESWSLHRPVWDLITERIWATVLLSGTALFISAGLGVWFGARAGWRNGSRYDKTTSSFAVTMYSVPEWWLGLLLLLFLGSSRGLDLFPVSGMSDPRSGLPHWLDIAYHLVLPVTSLAVLYIAEYSLIMRSSVLDERYTDYLNTARAKGLRDDQVLNRHALPNALLPSITLFFLSLGWVVGGTITVEKIFTWPGLGLLTADALKGPDIPLLQGSFVIFSAAVIVMNLLADLVYPLIDPRVKEV